MALSGSHVVRARCQGVTASIGSDAFVAVVAAVSSGAKAGKAVLTGAFSRSGRVGTRGVETGG